MDCARICARTLSTLPAFIQCATVLHSLIFAN